MECSFDPDRTKQRPTTVFKSYHYINWGLSHLSEFSSTIETSADILSQGFPCCGLRLSPIPHIPPRHPKLNHRSLKGGLVILKCLAYPCHCFNFTLNLNNPWLHCTAVSVVKVWLSTTMCDRRGSTRPWRWRLPDPTPSTYTSLFLLAEVLRVRSPAGLLHADREDLHEQHMSSYQSVAITLK